MKRLWITAPVLLDLMAESNDIAEHGESGHWRELYDRAVESRDAAYAVIVEIPDGMADRIDGLVSDLGGRFLADGDNGPYLGTA